MHFYKSIYRAKDPRGSRKCAKEWSWYLGAIDRRFTPEHVLRHQHQEELQKKASEVERDSGDGADESGEIESKQKAIDRCWWETIRMPDPTPSSSSEEEEEEEEDKPCKPKGVEHLIRIEKLNVDLTTSAQAAAAPTAGTKSIALSKKERALATYRKLHADLKTDEAREDLARLAVIRKRREEEAQRREAENKEKVLHRKPVYRKKPSLQRRRRKAKKCKPKGVEHLIGVEKVNNVDLTTSAKAAAAPTAGTKSIAPNNFFLKKEP